jgi:hypothetical protein
MNSYDAFTRKHRRLSILRVLEGAASYRSNEAILTQMANAFGITSTRDQVRTEIAWLQEAGFITSEDIAGLMIATATTRGVEIAQGIASHPDIARPSPKA